ncbi:hypothetical protein DAEQUDRAFT_733441 [Daedalea quercina L-15889]|uniref:SH3 domain-containing protein n=1 Tax=Daedalea quercina L-15889 TaxID=1314783 RepID=A0A165KZM2_9APHY|nr:hypothetical protein DAEQUDRAFT_733441 [Daedalea quercina L-15889]
MRNNVHKKRPSGDQPTTPSSAALSPPSAASKQRDEDITPTTSSMKTAFDRTGASPPTTPTFGEVGPNLLTPPATPKITIPEPIASPAPDSLPDATRPAALNLSQRNSLTSSRPAPPSPALSRRTSAALSRRSSTRSRRASKLPIEASTSVPPTPTPAPEKKRKSFLVKIRDFAFPRSDDRHVGKGADVPRPNRVRMSTASTSSSSSSASGIPEDEPGSGWASFKWTTLGAHMWPNETTRDSVASADSGGPSRTDFERNFDASSPSEEVPDPYNADDQEYDEEYVQPGEEGPLVPGLYRAMFAFEPEGTAEMALDEEQIVRIVGRGGGVGWAIVEKEDGGHALVPESYLELVQADEEED